ncbi:MAG: SusC/RagA family TonB-linked outer membrane protein [Paludibacter sp.]|nr:SusC/RagA family TonB-linked outer membrane protein [Paludibacter sp.]
MKINLKSGIAGLFLMVCLVLPFSSNGQITANGSIIQGQVKSGNETLIGVNVSEMDANNRIVSGTVSDVNGHYVLRVKSLKNRLSVSYVGYVKQIVNINGKKVVNIVLAENNQDLNTVEVVAKKKNVQGGYSIPIREIGGAMQTLNMKELEGLQVSSVDEALQGRIAGMDIVANSSDPGTGASMRIRGITSITGNSQPLIVVNNVPYEVQVDPNFDYANSNSQQYANMLSINPDDILDITVLKDAGSSAIWGSKGANGVIQITTKKGIKGPTRVEYSYRYTNTVQPKGMNMLNGGDFTMLMKEERLNPLQDESQTTAPEYNYIKNFPEYENFNNNTDWVKKVTQTGNINDHYLTVSGGGDRANYRVSGGYLSQNGTIIGQKYTRFSSRANMEYAVSDRIKFITEISLTNADNYQSYSYNPDNGGPDGGPNNRASILDIAYKKMPNVSVYQQDRFGNSSDVFYNISPSSGLNDNQKKLVNPVGLALQATNNLKSFRITPTFRLQFDLLDPNISMLRFSSYVSFDIDNSKTSMYLPAEVSNYSWTDATVNRADNFDSESVTIQSDENLAWQPKFENTDHSLLLYGSFQITSGNSSSQSIKVFSSPSGSLTDASGTGYLLGASTSSSEWRNMAFMVRSHYAYKGRYIIDGTFRRDGSTKFGEGNKFGNFPGANLKYIISDEPFMKNTKKWLSMLAIRPSWGISGNPPGAEYLYLSRYEKNDSYIDNAAVKPASLQLKNLKWETTSGFNYGLDLGLFDDKYIFDINVYNKRTTDLLFSDVAISPTSGYNKLSYINGGSMQNDGWEVNFYANKIVDTKDFSIDFTFNLSNYKNTIIDLDPSLLASYNENFSYGNGNYLTRIQPGNSFGSIYGFKSLGVYTYDKYSTEHQNAPVAKDASGKVITDQNGTPQAMYYAWGTPSQYKFRGGDAKYEDVNHDGSIDALDVVYLGNSNPILNGGFGPTFRYKNLTCKMFFNFRYGNKIVNNARMNAENMYNDNNQSIATNWRWRKDGDPTDMPRALYGVGYNSLGSDRYVEDGSFLRFKYLTFNYTVPSKLLKKVSLNRLNLYLTFNNLLVFTKYTGVDPEVGYGNLNDNHGMSVDKSATPRTKDFTLGITVGL